MIRGGIFISVTPNSHDKEYCSLVQPASAWARKLLDSILQQENVKTQRDRREDIFLSDDDCNEWLIWALLVLGLTGWFMRFLPDGQ